MKYYKINPEIRYYGLSWLAYWQVPDIYGSYGEFTKNWTITPIAEHVIFGKLINAMYAKGSSFERKQKK